MSNLGRAFGFIADTIEYGVDTYKHSKAESATEQSRLRQMYQQQISADNEQKYRDEQAAQEMRNRAYKELMDCNTASKQINVQEINKASQSVVSKVSDTQSNVSAPNAPFDINIWNEGARRNREKRRERIVKSDDNERFKREILDMLDGISIDIRECVDKQSMLTMRLDNIESRISQSNSGKALFTAGAGVLSQSYQDAIIDRNINSIFK